jgi:tRNA nucleotidyltransferase/poly(A) polymerase
MAINFKDKIQSQLPKNIQNVLEICSHIANLENYKIFLIGGVVRDLFLNKKTVDIDVTVEGNAIDFCHKLVQKSNCKIIQVQENLKTAKVIFNDDIEIDFASTRQEFYPKRGHLPVVTTIGCTLEQDVLRRDFSINSLALSLNENDFGDIIDYVNGIQDLENKELRVLHNKSFIEDPSRIIRGLKFASRFGFHRENVTRFLQDDYIDNHLNMNISWPRMKSEIKQTFSLNNEKAYDKFLGTNLHKLFYAENPNLNGLEIKQLIEKYEVEFPWLVYLGTFLNNKEIIELFCFNRNEKKVFNDRDWLLSNKLPTKNSNYDVFKFFEKKSTEAIIIYYLLTKRKEALLYLNKLCHVKIELNGNDLIDMGVANGEKIGYFLQEILKRKLAGSIANKEDEKNFIFSKIK